MTKKIISQNSFTQGEISPILHGRSNTEEYARGLETATNTVVVPHGSIRRRNGSKYIAEVKDSSAAVRLLRYEYSDDVTFILEFGNQYIRFFTNSGQVLESNITITGITQANPGVVTATAHGLSNGDHVYITGVTGMTEVNSSTVPYVVANKTTNTFELTTVGGSNVNTTSYTAYSSGGVANRIYEISSPWTTAQLDAIRYVQNGTTMYLSHPAVAPRTLVRTSDTNWTLDTLDFSPPPTYESGYDPNVTAAVDQAAATKLYLGVVDLTDGSTYKWTASGSGTNEYYVELFAGGDPSISTPTVVVENATSVMTEGTVGSLAAGEYDYGDNDTLGYSTIYVRLTDGADPDSKSSQYVMYSESDILIDGDIGRQIVNTATGETGIATITAVNSGSYATVSVEENFTDTTIIAAGDTYLDLSPIASIEFSGTQAGSIINVRSEYVTGTLGDRVSISNITNANPGVVTTSSAHGLSTGDKVVISDVAGMTTLNGNIYTATVLTSTTFDLKDDDGVDVNTTNYPAYSSGGIARKLFTGVSLDAFRSADVGKYILANGGVLKITAYNSGTDVDALVEKSLNSLDLTSNWSIEVETWDATRGYPRAVGLYEERLVFGGTIAQPQTLWFSETGIYDGFGIGSDDEDSIEVTLSSNEVNEINWIAASRDLVIGTSGGEITIDNSGSTAGFTASTINQKPRTYHGSLAQQPIPVRDEILFIQASGRKIRTFRYDFNIDGYTGEDLTFLAEHITEGGVEEAAYAQEPDTLIYVVTTNGDLLVGTYDRPKKVIGWCKFTTDGTYENVQTISEGEVDQVWTVAKRTVNSSTKRFIELFDSGNGEDDTDGFSDSYLTLSNPITITGITAANPAVVTTGAAHGFSNGDTIIIKDLVDPLASDLDSTATNMSSLNGGTFTVANKTSTTFELTSQDTSAYNAYGSGGNVWVKVTTVSGLDHLEGKEVQVKGDGAVQPEQTVSSGSITLDSAAAEIVVGLAYTTTIKTLSLPYDIGLGSMKGQRVRWARPILSVYKSTKPLVNSEFLPARSGADLMNKKVPLKTGFLEYGALQWNNTPALTITVTDPLPMHLIEITGVVDAGVK